jgi:hypothetical protein
LKYFLALALILLLIGLITFGSSFASELTYKNEVINLKENVRSISGYFKVGEKIIVEFTPGYDWSKVTLLDEPDFEYPVMFIFFNITDQNRNTTSFEVALVRIQQGQMPVIRWIKLSEQGSLSVNTQSDNQTAEIGGIVNCDGEYVALVDMIIPPTAGLPLTLTLYKGVPQMNYPYRFLLLPGILIIVFGIVITIYYAVRKSRRKPRRGVALKVTKSVPFVF